MRPDVNVLVATSRSGHPHHPVAIPWLEDSLAASALGKRLAVLPMVAAGFLRLVTHPRVFVEPTPLEAAQEFLAALLAVEGAHLLPLSGELPRLEPLCRQHQRAGTAISDGWIVVAVLARRECLLSLVRDFVPLLPGLQHLFPWRPTPFQRSRGFSQQGRPGPSQACGGLPGGSGFRGGEPNGGWLVRMSSMRRGPSGAPQGAEPGAAAGLRPLPQSVLE